MAIGKTNSMIKFFKPKRATSILGINLEGNRLEAVVLRRSNSSLQVQQTVAVSLALSPLSGDPELVGREIRNHLDQAGIKERRCAVCLPLNWVLTVQTKLPDLAEEDVASYLQIEAERGFPSGHENLYIAHSRVRSIGGEQYATLMGIPRNHLASLERALKAAQLKPLTFSLGITALAGAPAAGGLLTLALGSHNIDLQVSSGGGIAALRSLDGSVELDSAQKQIDADLVAREIRITLGQLPTEFGKEVKTAKIFGRGDVGRQFAGELARRLDGMGVRSELMTRSSDAAFSQTPSPEIALSPSLALAANYLRGTEAGPEFLPPKVKPWQQLMSAKFSSRKLIWAGSAAGAVVLCVILAFGFQQWQISRLDAKWKSMADEVATVTTANDQMHKFQPWFNTTFPALRILRALTEAFPEEGSVTAKSVEIRDLTTVTCSGVARDSRSYQNLIEKLARGNQVSNLKTDSLRGQSPQQFTFSFQWVEGGNGN
jgi:hypothetical protein